jgi:hypothetical protein
LCDLTHILSDLYAEILGLFHNTPAEDVSAQNKKQEALKNQIFCSHIPPSLAHAVCWQVKD